MVKPLSFKGDKKSKKRKRGPAGAEDSDLPASTEPGALAATTTTAQPDTGTEDDDSWVTAEAPGDITGPIIFALPSDVPSCIACDANGKVFASELENLVEGDLTTAEPHDVRQVWVANR
ncbi:MAG: hypothetical protein M4579_007728, partial [Chaenotheca gracillima]